MPADRTERSLFKSPAFLALCVIVALVAWDAFELWNQEAFLEWKRQVGYVPFFVGLALLPLVGIPTTPLFVLAGATFSPGAALAGCAVSIAVNLAISHWLAHRWLRRIAEAVMRHREIEWPAPDRAQAFRFLFVVRMLPGVPTFLKNYVTALTDLPFRTYLWVSWIITYSYAVGFVIMGDSLVKQDPVEALLGLAVLAGGGALLWHLGHNRRAP